MNLRLAAEHHLADRQVQRKRRAVLAAPGHLAADADDLLDAGREIAREVAVVLLVIRRRHQHVDVAPEHFGLAVAEQPLGGRIERFDAAVRVDDDDAVDGRFDDRTPARLARAQLLLELHARAEVVEHARELAFAADRHFADRQMQREHRPVAAAAR